MKLVESILTRNPCYTAGRKITVKGLMLHSVGCPQPKASAFINSWNSPSHDTSCVHGFIDGNDGTAYQTLPWNHRGWHCGSGSKGSGNNTHIGVEMCEPACIRYTAGSNFTCSDMDTAKAVAKRTYEAAVELFAMLCKKYSLNPLADGAIISHREGYSRGIASNHSDPEHLWTLHMEDGDMQTFRAYHAQAGVRVSQHQHGIRFHLHHQLVAGVDNIPHRGTEVIADGIHIHIGGFQLQVTEEDTVQVIVVILAGVGQKTVKITAAFVDDSRQADDFRTGAHYNQKFQSAVLLKPDLRIIQFYIHLFLYSLTRFRLFQNKCPDVPGRNIRCTT